MDPVAHTLFGATLAETGLRKKSRYATATLIIGANAPDIDALATFGGTDFSLWFRRGWTHGILAMVVLPIVLTAVIRAWNKKRGSPEGFDLRWIAGLSFLSVWSHPLLDFMNTYGVRLLMPFDGTWFYGDTLFIVDPWFWLLTAAGVVLARSNSRKAIVGWSILAALATLLVMLVPFVHWGVKVLWALGVAAIIAGRWWRPSELTQRRVAQFGFGTLVVYIGVLFGLARLAENEAARAEGAEVAQSNPMPGLPFAHRVVVPLDDKYVVRPNDKPRFEVPREEPDAVVQRAFEHPSIRGFSNWVRFPYWTKERVDGAWEVTFRDLRYVDPGEEARGIGLARVRVPQSP